LLAVVNDDAVTAGRALEALSGLADEHALALADAAVVVRSADGVKLRQEHSLAGGEGGVGGGSIGLILGLALGIPVAGAVVGLVAGVGAAAIDTGVPDDELRRIGEKLSPGRAAVVALVEHGDWPRIAAELEPYGGDVLVSDVAAEIVTAFRR